MEAITIAVVKCKTSPFMCESSAMCNVLWEQFKIVDNRHLCIFIPQSKCIRICHWETIFCFCYFKIMVTTRYQKWSLPWNPSAWFCSKLPLANLQVTCALASCLLAPQNPLQLQDNCSLITKHLTSMLCHKPQMGRITVRFDFVSIVTASAQYYRAQLFEHWLAQIQG